MHVGLGLCFQNLDRKMSDADVYKLELGLAAEAEGRDSEWEARAASRRAKTM